MERGSNFRNRHVRKGRPGHAGCSRIKVIAHFEPVDVGFPFVRHPTPPTHATPLPPTPPHLTPPRGGNPPRRPPKGGSQPAPQSFVFKLILGFRWFPWCRCSPGAVGLDRFVFHLICGGFKGCQSEIEVKSK